MEEKKLWEEAERRVGFKIHLSTYILVNLGLTAINLWLSPKHLWVVFSALGWGVGVVSHYLSVYQFKSMFSIEKEFEKLKEQSEK